MHKSSGFENTCIVLLLWGQSFRVRPEEAEINAYGGILDSGEGLLPFQIRQIIECLSLLRTGLVARESI